MVVATGLFHGLFLLPIILRSFAFGVGDRCVDSAPRQEDGMQVRRIAPMMMQVMEADKTETEQQEQDVQHQPRNRDNACTAG